jgi:NDP-sugar pyrophosphorylase family protein
MLNIVIPMAGRGQRFQDAGYAFPKPLIDINGQTMIEVVVKNIRPNLAHRFIFICQKEHYDKYELHSVLKSSTDNNFEVVKLSGITAGAACTVLTASKFIDNNDPLLLANSDQFIDVDINHFMEIASGPGLDGLIMTFMANHPKWSYARVLEDSTKVVEVAEKKLISNNATVGVYYFKRGRDFINGARKMIEKNIRYNNEYYVCPVYNELILKDMDIHIYKIPKEKMHGLGTPEDLNIFLKKSEKF